MNKEKIWLSSPHMGGEELNYIHDAFQKNWIAPLGENVRFERDLEEYTGVQDAGVFTNGTASIHLALILLEIKPEEENFQFFHKTYPQKNFIYIGDNIEKDFITANKLGWSTIGLRDDGSNIHHQNGSFPKEYCLQFLLNHFKL